MVNTNPAISGHTEQLKDAVRAYWEKASCGTDATSAAKHSRQYFEEIEARRYATEPEILSFAQFTRAHGLRILEVGVGAGTDFIQWVRAGAEATGVDLTDESVENVRARLAVYGLDATVMRADCENLPFPDDSFDLVYSWGVIHHTADTWRAMDEILRVCRPGGTCKVMVYNRHSVIALGIWFAYCAARGRPDRPLSWALWHHMESVGTKAFTAEEIRRGLRRRGVDAPVVRSPLCYRDLARSASSIPRAIDKAVSRGVAALLGWRQAGWFMTIEFQKPVLP